MRSGILLAILVLTFVPDAFTQAGRVKPSPTPSPSTIFRPSIIFLPQPVSETAPSKAPQPTPSPAEDVIRVESALVPIPASVLDANGRAITSLRLDDFELKIDGKPAVISEIARAETPIRLAMLFDNSGSVHIAHEFEKNAAKKFFRDVLRPDRDMAALFSVATATRLEQPFTRDIPSLIRSIDMFPPPSGATALLDGLLKAAEYISGVAGRRVIVIVSDGDDTYSDASLEKVLRALQLANVQVYVVKTTDFENYIRTNQRHGNANIRQLAAERRMMEIAGQTGGSVYSPVDEKELDSAFRQISAELSQQYILSYYPVDDGASRGAYRQISLEVKGPRSASVRTRKGYYVPAK
jgi:Ca-activated chloride channel homolog